VALKRPFGIGTALGVGILLGGCFPPDLTGIYEITLLGHSPQGSCDVEEQPSPELFEVDWTFGSADGALSSGSQRDGYKLTLCNAADDCPRNNEQGRWDFDERKGAGWERRTFRAEFSEVEGAPACVEELSVILVESGPGDSLTFNLETHQRKFETPSGAESWKDCTTEAENQARFDNPPDALEGGACVGKTVIAGNRSRELP
jgi:hypothetical protein